MKEVEEAIKAEAYYYHDITITKLEFVGVIKE